MEIDIYSSLLKYASKAYYEDPIYPNYFGYQIIVDGIKKALF